MTLASGALRNFSSTRVGYLATLLALLLWGPAVVSAQTDHHTGRHKVKPVATTAASPRINTGVKKELPAWNFSLSVGNRQGGDLFRLEVINGNAVPWLGLDPGGFQTSRFSADFEGSTSWQGSVTREIGAAWRVRADAEYVRQNLTATALVGQTGARYRYDRMDLWSLGLGLERDLVDQLSAPYFGLALTMTHLAPVVNGDLAQTAWGGRLSLGYRRMVGSRTSLFMEANLEELLLDQGNFQPQARPPFDPEAAVDFHDRVTFFAVRAGLKVGIPR